MRSTGLGRGKNRRANSDRLVARSPICRRAEADALIRAMAPGEANAFEYHWRYRARPEQLPPEGSWRVWLLMAGRGFGKTRCGAEMGAGGGQGGASSDCP